MKTTIITNTTSAVVGDWLIEADLSTGAITITYVPTNVWHNGLYKVDPEGVVTAGVQHAVLHSFTWGVNWNTDNIDEDTSPADFDMARRDAAQRLYADLESAIEGFAYQLQGQLA